MELCAWFIIEIGICIDRIRGLDWSAEALCVESRLTYLRLLHSGKGRQWDGHRCTEGGGLGGIAALSKRLPGGSTHTAV